MASIQATRLKRGMLIKLENDLFRVLDLQHFTPGNKRGFCLLYTSDAADE